jgi:hypothetical protein
VFQFHSLSEGKARRENESFTRDEFNVGWVGARERGMAQIHNIIEREKESSDSNDFHMLSSRRVFYI